MRKAVIACTLAASALAAVPSALAADTRGGWGGGGKSLVSVGLTEDQHLVSFRVHDTSHVWHRGRISGLRSDTKLVGIDFRVQNGKLYGVGDRGGISIRTPGP
jgi:hypothetical protein